MSEKDAGMQEEDKVDYYTRNMTTYATNIVADAFRLFSVLGIASREGSKGFLGDINYLRDSRCAWAYTRFMDLSSMVPCQST